MRKKTVVTELRLPILVPFLMGFFDPEGLILDRAVRLLQELGVQSPPTRSWNLFKDEKIRFKPGQIVRITAEKFVDDWFNIEIVVL